MKSSTKNYIRAVLMMTGLVIGVGLFGLPYVIARSGALVGILYFIGLSVIVFCNHLIYGETLLRAGIKHRLAGLAGIYLGKWWKRIAVVASTLGFYAVIVAYIVVGGQFLHVLLSPFLGGSLLAYQIAFFSAMAGIMLIGFKRIVISDVIMTIFEISGIIFLAVMAATRINLSNYTAANTHELFLPYGVVLFAIGGAAAVPEVLEILSRDKKSAKSAIFWGSFIPMILMAAFAFAVVGAVDGAATKDAVGALGALFGDWILYAGAAFGLFAVATSFLPLALYAKEQFNFDFKLNKFWSWFLSCAIPFFIFLFGTKDFIIIISFAGAVFSGFEAFLVLWIYKRARERDGRRPEYEMRLPLAFLAAMGIIFLLGIAYEIGTFF